MRLFIAVEIPESWRDAAAWCRNDLERVLSSNGAEAGAARALRWVQPSALHLTLRFLGEWPEGRLAELQSALDGIDWPPPPSIEVGPPGFFGTPERLGVVWLGVRGDRDGLARLVGSVERALVSAGAVAEAKPYRPHLTLARVRPSGTSAQRRAIATAIEGVAARALEDRASTALEVRSIALVRSHLGPQGPRYEVLMRHGNAG